MTSETPDGEQKPSGEPKRPDAAPIVGRAKVPAWVPDWREISDRIRIPRWTGVASVPGQPLPPAVVARRSRNRRRTWLSIVLVLAVVIAGLGIIGGSYLYDSVPQPEELKLANSTEVFTTDGSQIAKLGSENRTEVPMGKLDKKIRDALIAGEDKNFYEHHGIDLAGIARAAWNNLTGGSLQGASTITQQYARAVTNEREITVGRKLREAVMARKLEDVYTKEQILGFYLNTVYFGRGAYGIGAAAQVYFGIAPGEIEKLNVAQAAVLGAVLKQPEGADGFDPAENLGNAQSRWVYVLNNMMENGWLTSSERATLSYPEVKPDDPTASPNTFGYNLGTGFVLRYVERELTERGVTKYLSDNLLGDWKNAGLRITTTIDSRIQKAMEAELNRSVGESTMSKQNENIIGAGVAVDPENGRVLAYYGGGNNGTETDWAGNDQPHPPASSGKIYTIPTILQAGYTIKSHWNSRELKAETDGYNLTNAGRDNDPTCDTYCTLEEMTIGSFNVPFFQATRKIGPDKVIEMARNAGVRTMWTDKENKPYDLTKGIPGRDVFDHYVGIGQYPITVLDHANGTATIANEGVYNKAHFVLKVERKNRQTGEFEPLSMGDEKLDPKQTIDQNIAREETSVLKQVPGSDAVAGEGRESAGKTGTWENVNFPGQHAHVWFTGFTTQISATFWLGSRDINGTPIKTPQGGNMGSAFPKSMWKRFMDQVHSELDLPAEGLPDSIGIGTINDGTGITPSAVAPDPSEVPPSEPPVTSEPPSPDPSPSP